jgi:hypothetical protein
VGVLCEDGVVIGADSSATFDNSAFAIMEQPFDKIDILHDKIIVASTGPIGLGQRFCAAVKKEWPTFQNNAGVRDDPIDVMKRLYNAGAKDFNDTGAPKGQYGALVAFPSNNKAQLVEYPPGDFQPELKSTRLWYASMGSAQHITDTFLAFVRDVYWGGKLPNVYDATFAVVWTLEHAIQINPGGVNRPVKVATLAKRDKAFAARVLEVGELDEHLQNIAEAKRIMREFRATHQPGAAMAIPPAPPSTAK